MSSVDMHIFPAGGGISLNVDAMMGNRFGNTSWICPDLTHQHCAAALRGSRAFGSV